MRFYRADFEAMSDLLAMLQGSNTSTIRLGNQPDNERIVGDNRQSVDAPSVIGLKSDSDTQRNEGAGQALTYLEMF